MNLSEGDFFYLPENPTSSCILSFTSLSAYLRVTKESTEFIANEWRKVLTLETFTNSGIQLNVPDEYWYEGIGSSKGIGPGYYLQKGDTNYLACFTRDDTTTFFNGIEDCEYILNTHNLSFENSAVVPNPVIGISSLQLPAGLFIDRVVIYDNTGRIMKIQPFNNNPLIIEASQYSAGLYFVETYSNNRLIGTTKFIVN